MYYCNDASCGFMGVVLGGGYYRISLTYWQSFEKHPQINMTTLTDRR